MENDQAARLRRMVRDARRVALVDVGPPLIALHALEPQKAKDIRRLATELGKAAAQRGVTLQQDDQGTPADWRLVIGSDEESEAGASLWEHASTIIPLAEATPTGVLATYSFIKAQHRLGSLPATHVIFAGALPSEALRAFESLRATCQRFLDWQALDWGVWNPADNEAGLESVIDKLLARLPVRGEMASTNPLAEPTAEAV